MAQQWHSKNKTIEQQHQTMKTAMAKRLQSNVETMTQHCQFYSTAMAQQWNSKNKVMNQQQEHNKTAISKQWHNNGKALTQQ